MARFLLVLVLAAVLVSIPADLCLTTTVATLEWNDATAYNPDLNGDEEISWWEAIVFWLDWCLNGDDIPE